MPKTIVSLDTNEMRTTIQARHHIDHADEPLDEGGTDTTVMPTEMFLGSLGSCIAVTAKLYADRKAWPLDRVEIELDFERFRGSDYEGYDGDEGFVHEIRKEIRLYGDLTQEQRERIVDVSSRCPVQRVIDTPTFWKTTLVPVEVESVAD